MYVTAKLHTMRKPQRFHVSPMSDGRILVQSDKSIGVFDFRTCEGVLNVKGHYFPHLNRALGAMAFTFPLEFVTECLEASPALDSVTHMGGVTFVNTIEVI
jgi:hypothetical protein